ncbi:hypothetical protein KIW84_065200 [Lathyrus oleraceus]|uniref:DUF7769 domain-containing protein n=1 Tax=Pisum sativum TaxID=3888 RepID=A0A9D4WG14_PEA|nr:hypothetical protein KIW84_065200 [Pisum sativum]
MADENESVISESSKKRGFLNNEDRKAICQILLCSSDANGNLIGTGVVDRVAASYNVHRSVIYRIWKQLKDTDQGLTMKKMRHTLEKIGIFPFVYEQPARRSSVNRVAGTIETKPIASVTREVNKAYLINKVLPAIENMWPREDVGKKIFIQQDNARSHISKDDPDFCRAASESEFDIQLTCQPPNSPDLNVLDLGFFNAIQSLQQKEPIKSIDELVGAVQKAFDEFSTVQSNKIFSTLQSCMIEIMKINESNKYKIPHMKKDMLYKQGGIPVQTSCDSSLVQEVTEYLQNYDS